jgi:autophagy-related protein 9
MRKDNYLVGMLNRGVLALHVPLPGMRRRRFMLTKTLEWNLQWAILDHMFDEHFTLRPAFLDDPAALQRRLRALAAANLLLSPFLLVFLAVYFFMRNAEKFYHHPGTIGSRRWTSVARWRLREFNELPHYVQHRLAASHEAACKYVNQFPNTALHHVAKFAAYVAGSFAALLLFMTLLDEGLLERPLLGRHVVWWLATLGIVLAASRAFVGEEPVAHDPEAAMAEVVLHTHHLPRHWRGRAHSAEVQEHFQQLFQYKVRSGGGRGLGG